MKTIKPYLILVSLLLSPLSFASEHKAGEELYKANCAVCHGSTGGMDMSKRLAPPIAAVRLHYIDAYPDEASFVEAVSNWVEKQDENNSRMRGAIQRFKIMPPISIPKEDAKKIASYIFAGNIDKPEGFKKHVQDEHGQKGMDMMKMNTHDMGMHKKQDKGMHEMMKNMNMTEKKQRRAMINRVMQERGMGGKRAKMMQQLNLSQQQNQQIQALIQEREKRIRPVKMEVRNINQTIHQLDTTSPDYKAKIFSLADEKAKRVHRIVIEKGEIRMKIEAVLTPEQRAKFKQMRQANRKMKHGSGMMK